MEFRKDSLSRRLLLVLSLTLTAAVAAVGLVEINFPGSVSNALFHFSGLTVNIAPTDTLSTADERRIDRVIREQKEIQERRGFQ